jgi:hypothetical protein
MLTASTIKEHMAKYRCDEKVENEHGQTLGFANWMGGPSLTYVSGIICEDGTKANWFKSAEADTYFTIPGYIHRKGKRVQGFLTCDDGRYEFVSYKG